MDERSAKTKFLDALKTSGFFAMSTYDPTRGGVPDVYACKNGMSVWVELKHSETDTLSHPLTTLQSVFLRDINDHGGIGVVIVSRGDDQWHTEFITEPGERKRFEYDLKSLSETVQWLVDQCGEDSLF